MRISAISDVHVKVPHDPADQLLSKFLEHPLVQGSQYVVLLGDIFDLMCGQHLQYLQQFSHLFDKMNSLVEQGKQFYYFEGNHDLHLEKLFLNFRPDGKLVPKQLPEIVQIAGKSYYFSHGDEHEVDNVHYQRYKKFIMAPPLRFVANHVMPYAVLNYIGERASKMSRKKGSRYFDEEGVKERFRSGVETSTRGKYDFVLGGHSHVKDIYTMANGSSLYINNGYALRSNSFITINDHQISFIDLT